MTPADRDAAACEAGGASVDLRRAYADESPAPAGQDGAGTAGTALLEARDLHHAFGGRPVLRGVDVSIAEGEVVGLVGPNGGGKTTALRILHRALAPDAGEVLLEGRDLGSYPGRERARRIAVMAQEITGEVPLSVADVVLLGRVPHAGAFGSTTEEDLRIATEALEHSGALHLARREFGLLSGGEKQRVLIARALAQQPRVLLMDEPTNHLDIGSQHHVLQIVREQGPATLVVLHDLNLAARYCDRVLVLTDGIVRADGPPAEALTADLVSATYGVTAQRATADDGTAQLLFRGQGPSPEAPAEPTGPRPAEY
ncbi:ABC transporter ATP-binding protein [Brachybacterium sacelli]|uniref:Iron complex transport system ATP-binding protein n=1 Tax=Brachybacterium sacelli TaxID=173364 RepID=A0ABS4WYV3_9MICO|nr:iron complex transport system ATP-binding protein [Brachybacterium sacelli]